MRSMRPTQVDVAQRAGVSRQTVSLVVQGDPRVSDASRDAVLRAMDELKYRPNFSARALATNRTGFLGIVLSGLDNSFHAELAELLRREGEAKDLIPYVSVVGDSAREQVAAAERFIEINADGLILVSPVLDQNEISRIGRQIPTVLVTHNIAPPEVDLVHSDDRAGSAAATRHLLEEGYRPLIHLGYSRGVAGDSSAERRLGYLQVVEDAGIEPETIILGGEPIADVAVQIASRFGSGFGLSCHNDLVAFQILSSLTQIGLQAGTDYGVTGYDNTNLAGFPGVGLTSVDQGTESIARHAIELTVERVRGRTERKVVTLPSVLVKRDSTRPGPRAN